MARNEADPEQVLRDYAMAFPEATEHFPWGERVVKVRGKVFVFLSQRGKRMVTVKLPKPKPKPKPASTSGATKKPAGKSPDRAAAARGRTRGRAR